MIKRDNKFNKEIQMTKKLPVSEQDRRNKKRTQQLNKMFAEVNKAWRENKKTKRNKK